MFTDSANVQKAFYESMGMKDSSQSDLKTFIKEMMFDASKLKRINVIGTSGCDKSTFSKELASKIKLPYVEMDSLFWKDDWKFLKNLENFNI